MQFSVKDGANRELITGAQPKAVTGHKMQSISVVFQEGEVNTSDWLTR